jgi:hypothetical protein
MPEFLPQGVRRPDFYVAAMGRSGSTMLCNWLTRPPEQLVFIEPFFTRTSNPRLLRIQLADFGLAVDDEHWAFADDTAAERFRRLMAARLRGRRWGFKEVLTEEHYRAIGAFSPQRVLITVRNIADVALSFFEKHRLQNNIDRFDDEWVIQYCCRESAGLLAFREFVERRGIPLLTVRYEDFTRSEETRRRVVEFIDWEPGGDTGSHLGDFDRGFEIERHGRGISAAVRARSERELDSALLAAAGELASRCAEYQRAFAYV